MYSNTRIKKMLDNVDELTKGDIAADSELVALKNDVIKADLIIKELTDKVTILITKIDKLEKVPK